MQNGIINNTRELSIPTDKFIYKSPKMKEVFYEMKRGARLANTILLVGESGVGKDKVALQIHNISERNNKPFVCVPIHTLSSTLIESELFGYERGAFSGAEKSKAGRFEATDGGTIYLPEISELTESIQLKLLYFLQYRTVSRVGQNPYHNDRLIDVRLIFATNEDTEMLVEQGRLRSDFYHRINLIQIHIPPLRERKEDIEPFTNYFIEKYSQEFYKKLFTVDDSVIEYFYDYDWPGNVRELENTIERALIKLNLDFVENNDNPILTYDHFDGFLDNNSSHQKNKKKSIIHNNSGDIVEYKNAQNNFKKYYFKELLSKANNKISLAAKIANMTPQGLRKILKQLDMQMKHFP